MLGPGALTVPAITDDVNITPKTSGNNERLKFMGQELLIKFITFQNENTPWNSEQNYVQVECHDLRG